MREDISCQCFFCQGFPQNFTQEEIHQAARELAAAQSEEGRSLVMGITKAQCKRTALETLLRVARSDTADSLHAASMLLSYAGAFPNYGYLPPAPAPSAPEEETEE